MLNAWKKEPFTEFNPLPWKRKCPGTFKTFFKGKGFPVINFKIEKIWKKYSNFSPN